MRSLGKQRCKSSYFLEIPPKISYLILLFRNLFRKLDISPEQLVIREKNKGRRESRRGPLIIELDQSHHCSSIEKGGLGLIRQYLVHLHFYI